MNAVTPTYTQGTWSKRNWTRAVLILLGILVSLAAIGYFAISAVLAERLTHGLRRPTTSTPADMGLTYEDVRFPSAIDKIPLSGWYVDSPGDKVIILVHATGGVRDDVNVGLPDITRAFVRANYDVLAFDLRGHGLSGGEGVSFGDLETRDVAGAVAYLKSRGITEAGLIGFSLGAATALNSTPDLPEIRAVVADSAFADIVPILDAKLPKESGLPPIFNPGLRLMENLMYHVDLTASKPERAMARMGDRPVLLIQGALDQDVPPSNVYALQASGAQNPNLQVWVLPDVEHVRAFKGHPEEYMARVIAFFDRYLR